MQEPDVECFGRCIRVQGLPASAVATTVTSAAAAATFVAATAAAATAAAATFVAAAAAAAFVAAATAAAAVSTAAAAAAVSAAAAATTASAGFTWFGCIDTQGASLEILFVGGFDCSVELALVAEGHESEAF